MITRQHMTLVLLSISILFLSGISIHPWECLAVILGACIGTIVPDIQMKKPKRLRPLTAAWVLAWVTRHTFTPAISHCYRSFFGISVDPSDKRITHSIPGMLILAGITAGLASIQMVFLPSVPQITLIPLLVLGFILGLVLHMVQDLCTKKGITPLYPFRSTSVSGSIRPCIVTDTRIGKFQVHHCGAAAGVLGIAYFSPIKGPIIQAISVAALALCLGLMVRQSEVVITHNPVLRSGHQDDKSPAGDPWPHHSPTGRAYHRMKGNSRFLLRFVEKSDKIIPLIHWYKLTR